MDRVDWKCWGVTEMVWAALEEEVQADRVDLSLVESFSSQEVYCSGEGELVQMLIFNFLKIEL